MGVYLSASSDSQAFLNNISVLACRDTPQTKEYAEVKEKKDHEESKMSALLVSSVALTVLAMIALILAPLAGLGGLALAAASCAGFTYSFLQYGKTRSLLFEKEEDIKKIVKRTTAFLSQKKFIQELDKEKFTGLVIDLFRIVDENGFRSLYNTVNNTDFGDVRKKSAQFLFENGHAADNYLRSKGITL